MLKYVLGDCLVCVHHEFPGFLDSIWVPYSLLSLPTCFRLYGVVLHIAKALVGPCLLEASLRPGNTNRFSPTPGPPAMSLCRAEMFLIMQLGPLYAPTGTEPAPLSSYYSSHGWGIQCPSLRLQWEPIGRAMPLAASSSYGPRIHLLLFARHDCELASALRRLRAEPLLGVIFRGPMLLLRHSEKDIGPAGFPSLCFACSPSECRASRGPSA